MNSGILHEFDLLKNYAYTHGNYLLDNSLFQIFDTTYETSQTLDSILRQFTTPTATQNQEAIQRLRRLQKSNFRQANKAYERLITPYLRQRMNQEHWPNQQDSPTPMRILSPPSRRTPTPYPSAPIPSTSRLQTTTERPRRQKNCYKCHQPFHNKRHCPKYRCQNCRRTEPGHLTHECPKIPSFDPQEYDYSYDYDPDGNLNGEQ